MKTYQQQIPVQKKWEQHCGKYRKTVIQNRSDTQADSLRKPRRNTQKRTGSTRSEFRLHIYGRPIEFLTVHQALEPLLENKT